jgi:hypothetical protein
MFDELRDNHYRGDEDFDGRTEMFLLNDSEEQEMHDAITEAMEATLAD